MTFLVLDDDLWDPARTSIRLERLCYLKWIAPPLALQCLDCPALEDMTIVRSGFDSDSVTHVHNFLSQSPRLHTLRLLNVVSRLGPDVRIRKYLVPSSLKHLSLHFTVNYTISSESALIPLKILSEKHTDTSNAGSSAFCVLPELESLDLDGFVLSLASVLELIAARWNTKERRLKSMKLTRCFVQLSPDSKYIVTSDLEISSTVRRAAKSFTEEGLRLEIS